MSQLTFRGAYIRHFDGRRPNEGDAFVRFHVTCDYSEPVRKALDWPPLPDGVDSMEPSAELAPQNAIMEPADPKLAADYRFDLALSSVDHFAVVRVEGEKSDTVELRFQFVSSAKDAGMVAWNYLANVGQHKGTLKLSYSRQEQMELATVEAKA